MRKFVTGAALATALVLGGLLGTSPAKATTFHFSYTDVSTGGTIVSASGLLTVSFVGPYYQITGISGTYNTNPITSLFAPGGFQGNDNKLFLGSPQLTTLGFSFNVAALSQNINVYYDGAGSFICAGCYGNYNGASDVVINFSAATPLPAALPLFATGLGAMGVLGWRRKKRKAAAA